MHTNATQRGAEKEDRQAYISLTQDTRHLYLHTSIHIGLMFCTLPVLFGMKLTKKERGKLFGWCRFCLEERVYCLSKTM